MIKLYFLGIASLLGLAFVGIDWYMTAKKLRWEAVAEVWPFWSLLMVVAFLLGGAVWGVIAQATLASDLKVLNAEFEQEKATYRQTVENDLKDERAELIRQDQTLGKRVKLAEQALDKREQTIEESLESLEKKKQKLKAKKEALTQAQAEVQQLILDKEAENEGYRVRALNAGKALERDRKKYKATIAKLEQDNTEQSS